MKTMTLLMIMAFACGSSHSSYGTESLDPQIRAFVKEVMPGNIMADDVPPAVQPKRRFERMIFVLLPSTVILSVDSILYNGQGGTTASANKIDPTALPYHIGTLMNSGSISQLKLSGGKTWWIISVDNNESLEHLPPATAPIEIHAKTNGSPVKWNVDKEVTLSPSERY